MTQDPTPDTDWEYEPSDGTQTLLTGESGALKKHADGSVMFEHTRLPPAVQGSIVDPEQIYKAAHDWLLDGPRIGTDPIEPAFTITHKLSDWESDCAGPQEDLRNLAKVRMDYAFLAGPYGSGPGLLRKLTWRGIPEQRPDGSWVEIWHAHVSGLIDHTDRGGRGLFTAELRECFGRDHTAILRDRDGRELGHFLTLTGAQNRARRHFQGRA